MPLKDVQFALIGPIVRMCDKPLADRIVTDVFPLARITVSRPKLRVPLVPLKYRIVCVGRGNVPVAQTHKCLRNKPFPIPHPPLKRKWRICRWRTEKMHMVRHDNIASHKPCVSLVPRIDNAFVRNIIVQGGATSPLPLANNAYRDKKNDRPVVMSHEYRVV